MRYLGAWVVPLDIFIYTIFIYLCQKSIHIVDTFNLIPNPYDIIYYRVEIYDVIHMYYYYIYIDIYRPYSFCFVRFHLNKAKTQHSINFSSIFSTHMTLRDLINGLVLIF